MSVWKVIEACVVIAGILLILHGIFGKDNGKPIA